MGFLFGGVPGAPRPPRPMSPRSPARALLPLRGSLTSTSGSPSRPALPPYLHLPSNPRSRARRPGGERRRQRVLITTDRLRVRGRYVACQAHCRNIAGTCTLKILRRIRTKQPKIVLLSNAYDARVYRAGTHRPARSRTEPDRTEPNQAKSPPCKKPTSTISTTKNCNVPTDELSVYTRVSLGAENARIASGLYSRICLPRRVFQRYARGRTKFVFPLQPIKGRNGNHSRWMLNLL